MSIPSEAIGIVSGNFPTYLLVKDGDLHTLSFSTANIEGFLRQNAHMFRKDGIQRADLSFFPELAPQDLSVEGMDGDNCKPEREFRFRIVNNTSLTDSSTTVEVTVFECGELIDREIWHVLPCRCENGNTLLGANLFPWDIGPRTCGDVAHIPCRSTDNGVLVIANFPNCGCGAGHERGRVAHCNCR